ncbi:hypothetical protein CCHL11_03252 [Colletotrichum chlorophyti]|uniref:Uncharacterized protein n=1 Tax=Colletotrichum chlorophyti TaxID=708187 RepID=A0A1Q8S401_9PEZI|nr:hypothetical protein CCHL11_03252 [Colletotrichum chlorophyti]
MEGTATWSTLRQRRRRPGPRFPGRLRHDLVRRYHSAALHSRDEEGEEADGEKENVENDEEEEEEERAGRTGNQRQVKEEEEEEEEGEEEDQEEEEAEGEAVDAESESEAGRQAGANSSSDSSASDSEQEQPPPAASPPPPPPAAPSLPPPAAQGPAQPSQLPVVVNPAVPASIPPARGFVTLVPGAPPPSNPPRPPQQETPSQQSQRPSRAPPSATPTRPPTVEPQQPQQPPPASQPSSPPLPPPPPAVQPSTPPAAETPSMDLLPPPPAVENAASGTPQPDLLPPNSQVEAPDISATPAPSGGTDRGVAIGIAFAVVAIIALIIGATIFFVKRNKRKKKVAAVATNMNQNAASSPSGNGNGNAFFPRESAIMRQPKRDTREMERAIIATYRQTKIAYRTTGQMEEQMMAQFRAGGGDNSGNVSNIGPFPVPPTMAANPPTANNNVMNARSMQAESFYYDEPDNVPAIPAPLRLSTSQRKPTTASAQVPYPVSTYDMYQELGQGPYRESISIGFQPYNPDSYYQQREGGLPRDERGPDGRLSPDARYS